MAYQPYIPEQWEEPRRKSAGVGGWLAALLVAGGVYGIMTKATETKNKPIDLTAKTQKSEKSTVTQSTAPAVTAAPGNSRVVPMPGISRMAGGGGAVERKTAAAVLVAPTPARPTSVATASPTAAKDPVAALESIPSDDEIEIWRKSLEDRRVKLASNDPKAVQEYNREVDVFTSASESSKKRRSVYFTQNSPIYVYNTTNYYQRWYNVYPIYSTYSGGSGASRGSYVTVRNPSAFGGSVPRAVSVKPRANVQASATKPAAAKGKSMRIKADN